MLLTEPASSIICGKVTVILLLDYVFFPFLFLRFDRAVRLFGEDNTSIQPDDFFGIFDAFLTALNEAKQDNENLKRRRDEEEKRAKQEAEVSFYLFLAKTFHLIKTVGTPRGRNNFQIFYISVSISKKFRKFKKKSDSH